MRMLFCTRNPYKLSVDEFIHFHKNIKDNGMLTKYVTENVYSMSNEDLIKITVYCYSLSDLEELCFNVIKKSDLVPELIEYIISESNLINGGLYRTVEEVIDGIINHFIRDNEIDINDLNNKLTKTIKSIIDERPNNTTYYFLIGKIKNKEYILSKLVYDEESYKKNKQDIIWLINKCKGLNNEAAILLAPHMLVVDRSQNIPYMLLIYWTINRQILKYEVLSTYNKEIIVYYIYKTKDYDLLDKIFKNGENYLNYCNEIYGEYDIIKKIKRFVREDYKFRYVDSNIKDFLESSNEMPDVHVKRQNN